MNIFFKVYHLEWDFDLEICYGLFNSDKIIV